MHLFRQHVDRFEYEEKHHKDVFLSDSKAALLECQSNGVIAVTANYVSQRRIRRLNSSLIMEHSFDEVYENEMHMNCQSVYWGTNAILFQLMGSTIYFAANKFHVKNKKMDKLIFTVKQIATLQLPSRFAYLQVIISGLCLIIAIFLYGVRGTRYETMAQGVRNILNLYHYSIFIGWFAIGVLQYFMVIWASSDDGDDDLPSDDSADRVTDLSVPSLNLEEKMKSMSKSTKAIFGVEKSLKSKERKRKSTVAGNATIVATAGLGLSKGINFNNSNNRSCSTK